MLKRLLALLADGDRTWSSETLARELNVPSPLVGDLLARLGSEGYLSCASRAASSVCARCSMRTPACDEASGPTIWQLTDKARVLLSEAGVARS